MRSELANEKVDLWNYFNIKIQLESGDWRGPSQPSQTTGLTIIITGPGYHLSPGLNYCEYQDTMTDNDLH